jgi:hypothetical protein
MTVGALDAVIVADKGALFKYEQVHTSMTEYTIDCPLVIVVSVQDVVVRDDDEQAFAATTEDPVNLDTFHDEKLQYEFEHGFAPADQEMVIEAGKVDEEENVIDDGVLAVTRADDDVGRLLPSGHVHPSTTVYMYALFGATFDTLH